MTIQLELVCDAVIVVVQVWKYFKSPTILVTGVEAEPGLAAASKQMSAISTGAGRIGVAKALNLVLYLL